MSLSAFPEGVQRWAIEKWENGHQNFVHRFSKNASFKLTLPNSLPTNTEKYKATTRNFMWLINHAVNNSLTMRAMGNGWSFSEVAVCPGGVVDTKSLRLTFALKDNFVAPEYLQSGKTSADLFLVQCGVTILDLNERLEAGKRSLKASGASNGQTIVGATATGTHGSAYKVGAVHDSIVGMHIVVGTDRHVFLERKSNPVASPTFIQWLGAEQISDDDLFNAAVVSFGCFGFIHSVVVETEPLYLLEENRSGEIVYDQKLIDAMNTLDFAKISNHLPYLPGTPGKDLYHFELLVNPHDFEAGNPEKGIYIKTLYKLPYRPDYPKRQRDSKGFTYGENTLGLIQTILDTAGSRLSNELVKRLVTAMLPLAFKPSPAAFGTLGETFNNTRFRGKAASAAIGINAADTSRVLEEIVAQNKVSGFAGALAFRYVKGTKALLAFTKFPLTCILEMDGVDSAHSRQFFSTFWNRLDQLGIPYTLHWGKINFHLNKPRVRKMYGDATVNKWLACRRTLLNEATRKVFTNTFMQNCGLAD